MSPGMLFAGDLAERGPDAVYKAAGVACVPETTSIQTSGV